MSPERKSTSSSMLSATWSQEALGHQDRQDPRDRQDQQDQLDQQGQRGRLVRLGLTAIWDQLDRKDQLDQLDQQDQQDQQDRLGQTATTEPPALRVLPVRRVEPRARLVHRGRKGRPAQTDRASTL